MKKILMMMAMAVGFTVFADSQNDKLISFSTSGTSYYQDGLTKIVDNECFALVWIKDGSTFGGFNADGTLRDAVNNKLVRVVSLAKDGHCPPITFVIPADEVEGIYAGGSFAVYLLDTRDANGQPAIAQNNAVGRVNWFAPCANSGDEVDAAEDVAKVFGSFVCTYADGTPVLEGERCLLIQGDVNGAFCGITWNGQPADAIVDTFFANQDGKFAIDLGKTVQGKAYELIVLDTRIPGGSGLVAAQGDSLKLVSGFGEFVLSDDGSAISKIKWSAVKMGADAAFNVSNATFGFDPAKNLENGYASIFDLAEHPGLWAVYPLPQAYVTKDDVPATISGEYDKFRWPASTMFDDSNFQLDASYAFDAYERTGDAAFDLFFANHSLLFPGVSKHNFDKRNLLPNARAVVKGQYPGMDELVDKVFDWYDTVYPFFNWNADFVVTFNRPVAADSVVLAGNYTGAAVYGFDGWVCSSAKALEAGEEFRLLTDNEKKKVYVAYHEICTLVKEFKCGVINNSPANYGTTMTVNLNLYPNIGTVDDNSVRYLVGTYRYTFKGPLNVKFYKDGEELTDLAISTTHDGSSEIPLPALKGDDTTAFVAWSNLVTDVVYSNSLPARTWTTEDAPLKLGACFKAAKKVEVTAKSESGEELKPQIKVTKEWLEEKVGAGTSEKSAEQITEELNKPAAGQDPEKGLKVWEAYVLGLDPKDAKSSVKVKDTNGQAENAAIVIGTVQAPPPDSGFRVTYSLDKVEADEKTPVKVGEEQVTKDLKIDLEPAGGETPTGYYKMNVIVRPDEAPEAKKIVKPSDNTIGVLKVETEEQLVPIAVPWLSLEAGSEVMPDEIVDPRTLSENDQLHVWQESVGGQQNIYSSWHVEGGKWVANKTEKVNADMSVNTLTAAAAREGSVKCGKGVWLQRKDTTKPFYLVGQYDQMTESKVEIIPGTAAKAEYNLIAPTSIEKDGVLKEETDLNAIPSLNSADVNPNDQLMIIRKGVPTYFRRSADGKWGYNKTKVTWVNGKPQIKPERYVDGTKVPLGLGLWYISTGGSPTVNWKEGEQSAQ